MKKIDYNRVMKRAAQTNITPQLQLKRELHYRPADNVDRSRNRRCENCKSCFTPPWKDSADKLVCATIGIKKEFDSFVKYDHICDEWSRK